MKPDYKHHEKLVREWNEKYPVLCGRKHKGALPLPFDDGVAIVTSSPP